MSMDTFTAKFTRKPFKVCNLQRNNVKGIVIGSLEELKERACESLGLDPSTSRVFIEDDGTEIEDGEYLSTLEQQTKLLITEDRKDWIATEQGPQVLYRSQSFKTFSQSLERNESLDMDDTDAASPISEFLIKQIKRNPIYFVSFSNEQLQSVIDCDLSYLASTLGMAEHEARFYQEACQREFDKRTEMQNASELLRLYDKAMQQQQLAGSIEPESKKHKT